MKKIIFIIICLWGVSVSCSEDHKIGAPDEIQPDYVLPQGDASDEANARIQDIFDTYGSYVLYNYSSKDAFWTQTSAGTGTQTYVQPFLRDGMFAIISELMEILFLLRG